MIRLLSNIRLNLTQYLLATSSAAIGVLLVLLRLKGSKLHETQLRLLEVEYEAVNYKNEEKAKSAKERYRKALKEYNDA